MTSSPRRRSARRRRPSKTAIVAVAVAFFLAELGDKTMLATITLATKYGWFGTWLGSTIGMVAADALAILVGRMLGRRLPEKPSSTVPRFLRHLRSLADPGSGERADLRPTSCPGRVTARVEPAELLRQGDQVLVAVVEVAGALVIFVGAVGRRCGSLSKGYDTAPPPVFTPIRLSLGRFLTLGLEFQLAADVLRTAVSPSFEQIGQLAAIATIRTALNYFLGREIRQEQRQVAEGGASTVMGVLVTVVTALALVVGVVTVLSTGALRSRRPAAVGPADRGRPAPAGRRPGLERPRPARWRSSPCGNCSVRRSAPPAVVRATIPGALRRGRSPPTVGLERSRPGKAGG